MRGVAVVVAAKAEPKAKALSYVIFLSYFLLCSTLKYFSARIPNTFGHRFSLCLEEEKFGKNPLILLLLCYHENCFFESFGKTFMKFAMA